MKALDLFCGGGGAGMGLHQAGFEVVGVDINFQPEYPFEFIRADAFNLPVKIEEFDLIWASPRCQTHTWGTRKGRDEKYPDQVEPIRKFLDVTRKPYIIENVPGAPLNQTIYLTGGMFNLPGLERKRVFEIKGFRVEQPKYRPRKGPLCTVAGHGGNSESFKLSDWKKAMGIDWMAKERLTQAIPPAYSHYIGRAAVTALRN
jgi:DNA (cytosine-5)-methyltransferase 1